MTTEHSGLVFSSKKGMIQQPKISIYGAVFSQHGMKSNSDDKGITRPPNTHQKELPSF